MTQTAAFTRRVDRLCGGRSPYDGFLAGRYTVGQGWNSHHAYLADTLQWVRPSIVLALGGQKGWSTIHIVETMRPMGSEGIVIAVDAGSAVGSIARARNNTGICCRSSAIRRCP